LTAIVGQRHALDQHHDETLPALAGNSVLKQRGETLLEQAQAQFAVTKEPQRLFAGFWYQAGTWDRPRWVVVKAEAHAKGTNRRFVITNRPGARVLPQAAYDDYAARGECENRNKELKCDLAIPHRGPRCCYECQTETGSGRAPESDWSPA
jgi:hypothetical protein